MQKWFFTFCCDDEEHCNDCVVFEGTYGEAREKMWDRFGSHWAFQYSEEEFEGQVEAFGLREIK